MTLENLSARAAATAIDGPDGETIVYRAPPSVRRSIRAQVYRNPPDELDQATGGRLTIGIEIHNDSLTGVVTPRLGDVVELAYRYGQAPREFAVAEILAGTSASWTLVCVGTGRHTP